MATTSTTTGLNVSGIAKIKSQIASYKSKVKKQAENLGAKTSVIHKAIQGDSTIANLNLELNRINSDIKNLLNELDVYTNYLDTQLKSTYQSHDKSNDSFYSSSK